MEHLTKLFKYTFISVHAMEHTLKRRLFSCYSIIKSYAYPQNARRFMCVVPNHIGPMIEFAKAIGKSTIDCSIFLKRGIDLTVSFAKELEISRLRRKKMDRDKHMQK